MIDRTRKARILGGSLCLAAACLTIAIADANAGAGGLGNDIVYSIMVDRFSSGNRENDVPQFAYPGEDDYDRSNRYWLYKMYYKNASKEGPGVSADSYWGGDLQGVVNKLEYLHYLGVTVVILSPVFENVNGYQFELGGTAYHGYWTKDLMRLEEHFVNPPKAGETMQDVLSRGVLLKGLIDKAHSFDPPIKIVLDVVLNHTSPAPIETTIFDDSNYLEMGALFDDGQYVTRPCGLTEGRTCRETYIDSGWFHPPSKWVDWNDPTTLYDGYLNGNLADLDQRSPQVREYLVRGLRKWLSLGIDGFRFDAAKNIYPNFLTDLESLLTEEYPRIILIGEYFDGGIFESGLAPSKTPSSIEWLQGLPYATMFNFSFAEAIREYFTGRMDGLGTPYIIRHILDSSSPYNPLKSRSTQLVTFINNQDIPRMLSLDGSSPERYEAALKLLFVAPGVPKLFYGDEIGLAYYDSDDHWQRHEKSDPVWSRIYMPWDNFEAPLAKRFLSLTRSLIRLRKEKYFLKAGEIEFLSATNVIDIVERNSYIAVQRSKFDKENSDYIIYLYSAKHRDRLEFDVSLPDGEYLGLHNQKAIQVRNGRLVWSDIRANESIIIGPRVAMDLGAFR